MSDTPNQVDSEEPAGRNRSRRNDPLPFAVGYASLLLVGSLVLSRQTGPALVRQLQAEWALWFSACQFVGMMLIVVVCGWPKTPARWLLFVALNAVLVGMAVLHAWHLLEPAALYLLELTMRLVVAAMWGISIVGIPFFVWGICRRRRLAIRKSSRPAKLWFFTVVSLMLLEPIAAVVDRSESSPRLHFPDELQAPADDELRIAAIGGSTMVGAPYDPKFGIPAVVGWRLRQLYPGRKVVVENLAVVGQDLYEAINSLEQLTVRPHLLLVYSGHNEFFRDLEELTRTTQSPFGLFDRWLAWSPTFRALDRRISQRMALRDLSSRGERADFEGHIAAPPAYRRRLERFRHQLEQLAQFCRRQRIATLWFVPAANEADFEPNRSVFPPDATDTRRNEIRRLYDRAAMLQAGKDWAAAADLFRQGLALVPSGAEFHFGLARCLAQQDRHDEARPHFQAALEEDGHPIRANRDYRRTVAEVAAAHEIPLVDAAEVLRPHTEHGILDGSVFVDHVHPNLRGFYLLGMAAVGRIVQTRLLEPWLEDPADAGPAEFATAVADAGITAQDLAKAYTIVADGLRWLERWRFRGDRRLEEAARFKRRADQLQSGQIKPGEAGTELLF